MLIATDLEGVLIPRRQEIAQTFAPGTEITTREEPTEKLALRIGVLRRADASRGPSAYRPQRLPSPAQRRSSRGSRRAAGDDHLDTFHEFSDLLAQRLGRYNLFANRFRVGEGGRIEGVQLRIRGMKVSITRAFRELGFTITAIGDSSNDHTMLEDATVPILFNPTADLRRSLPQAPAVTNYVELKNLIEKIEDAAP